MLDERDPASPAPLIAALHAGSAHDGDARKAALGLLIWHETWLRRQDFRLAAVQFDVDDDGNEATSSAVINWYRAEVFATASPRASSSELAILNTAIVLATDSLGLGCLGNVHRWHVASAVAKALGYSLAEPVPVNHNHPAFTGREPGCPACKKEAGDA
jgi:hypothetical protein